MNGFNLAACRKKLGLTQVQFGWLFGVHPVTVSKWERGIKEPTVWQQSLILAVVKGATENGLLFLKSLPKRVVDESPIMLIIEALGGSL